MMNKGSGGDGIPAELFHIPGGSDVKKLPVVQEAWVQSLGWEEPLEKGIATHSSILGLP